MRKKIEINGYAGGFSMGEGVHFNFPLSTTSDSRFVDSLKAVFGQLLVSLIK
jgi:hypothetical protein